MLREPGVGETRRLYSRAEACEVLNISLPTFHRLVRSGRLRVVHISRRTLVEPAEVERLIDLDRP